MAVKMYENYPICSATRIAESEIRCNGADSDDEHIVGCSDVSGGCHESGGIGQILITVIEYYTGIG